VFDVFSLFRAALLEPAIGPLDCRPQFRIGSVDSGLLSPFCVEVKKSAAAHDTHDGQRPKHEHQ
jgi:hypothetical protein